MRVSQQTRWAFEANFAVEGDLPEIIALDSENRSSSLYFYTFKAPPFTLSIDRQLGLSWNPQLGRLYSIEYSTNLVDWTPLRSSTQGLRRIVPRSNC